MVKLGNASVEPVDQFINNSLQAKETVTSIYEDESIFRFNSLLQEFETMQKRPIDLVAFDDNPSVSEQNLSSILNLGFIEKLYLMKIYAWLDR